jgi:6-phosphogluconolactonase
MRQVEVVADATAVARAAAARIASAAEEAMRERGRFTIALSGGMTPRETYALLAEEYADAIAWPAVHVFWADERCVPPGHAASNYRMASEILLRRVGLPMTNIHRVRGEVVCEEAAMEYDNDLARFFEAPQPTLSRNARLHAIDLVVLGVGADGHTASLFPGSTVLASRRWAATSRAPAGTVPRDRVTLTLAALGTALDALFLAIGPDKKNAVRNSLAASPDDPSAPPAARVQPLRSATWILDQAAAE